jgi:hypothetical protein
LPSGGFENSPEALLATTEELAATSSASGLFSKSPLGKA